MNQWKSAHAVATDRRTLTEALEGADVFFGLSAKGAVTRDMVRGMGPQPIIFAMANPDPEITPEDVQAVRDDATIATGRARPETRRVGKACSSTGRSRWSPDTSKT